MAGWQTAMHGATVGDILRAKGVQQQVGLYRGYSDIATDNELHEGIEITDNYGEYSGKWEFDVYPNTPWTKLQAAAGQYVSGTWKVRAESFKFGTSKFVTDNLTAVKTAYNDIQSQIGKMKVYHISGIPSNCRTEANRVIERALRVIQK